MNEFIPNCSAFMLHREFASNDTWRQPPQTNGQLLNVTLSIYFLSMFSVNEDDGTVRAMLTVNSKWQDYRLKHSFSECSNAHGISVMDNSNFWAARIGILAGEVNVSKRRI